MPVPSDLAFVRAAQALGPYLGELVLVGAWAHRLYRLHPLATAPEYPPLMTRDVDFAAPERIAAGERSISELLVAAGFREEFKGGDPPVTAYHAEGQSALFVELITPLFGSGTDRQGAPRDVAVVAGARAPRLRFVDLLLVDPWELLLTSESGLPIEGAGVALRVAHPAKYLAQKVLSLPQRRKEDRKAKDLLYIFDTLTLFGGHFPELREAGKRVLAALHRNARKEFSRLCSALPGDPVLVMQAARIAEMSGRPATPSAERVSTLCRLGLSAVFEV